MDKNTLAETAALLREIEDYLDDCDENLADEIGARDGIAGRMFMLRRELPELRAKLLAGAKQA